MFPERRVEHAVEALVAAPRVVHEQVEPAVLTADPLE
jgi:hypothetical protein